MAEATARTWRGSVTVTEHGHTAEGARQRALLALRERTQFAGFRRNVGFENDLTLRSNTVGRYREAVGFA